MERIFEKISKSNHLPQLPQVMVKLVRLFDADNADSDEVTRIISADPALTAKLLRIIASPYVNLPRKVNTLKNAVVYLGLDTIRNLAISSSAMHFFKMSETLPGFDMPRFWRHAYKCGVLARQIAAEDGQANPEEFFLAGLLHNIGTLVLMRTFPKAYAEVLTAMASGIPKYRAETDRFGLDTPQVSAWLFNQWQLNPVTADAVLFLNASMDRVTGELPHVKILYMADALACDEAGVSVQHLTSLTHIPEIRLAQIATEAEDEVAEMAGHLGLNTTETDKDEAHTPDLGVKEFSLFYGTLEALTAAKNREDALTALQRGLSIMFNIPRVFFFLLDPEDNMLKGTCHPDDRHYPIVRSIALNTHKAESLPAKSTRGKTCLHSFTSTDHTAPDTQIIRLLETEGLYCIPITSRATTLGTMVLGVTPAAVADLERQHRLVNLFSRQTGTCLENLSFHANFARDVGDKKLEAFATLTDRVVHEINNPVAIAKNYLDALKIKLPANHPAQEELSVVGEEMVRVSSILTGLSSFSSPRLGGIEPIDLNTTCARVLRVLNKSLLLPRRITVETDFDPGLPAARMDENGLKQILINLVKNAAEAMDSGGELYLATRQVPGSARVVLDEKKKLPGIVEIIVRDNGPGIPERIKAHLFEPYNSTKPGRENSGLGLSIVHSVVREMNGRITCHSQGGAGTSFSVYLPLVPSGNRHKTPDAATGLKNRNKGTIHG
ncbi:MAG: HDOD domain-containing protein [Desulfobacterales bacterium]|nr:HDOD domain-containing protein [Desulfobacterales bacterium]